MFSFPLFVCTCTSTYISTILCSGAIRWNVGRQDKLVECSVSVITHNHVPCLFLLYLPTEKLTKRLLCLVQQVGLLKSLVWPTFLFYFFFSFFPSYFTSIICATVRVMTDLLRMYICQPGCSPLIFHYYAVLLL